jgi:hypothetical protein
MNNVSNEDEIRKKTVEALKSILTTPKPQPRTIPFASRHGQDQPYYDFLDALVAMVKAELSEKATGE